MFAGAGASMVGAGSTSSSLPPLSSSSSVAPPLSSFTPAPTTGRAVLRRPPFSFAGPAEDDDFDDLEDFIKDDDEGEEEFGLVPS